MSVAATWLLVLLASVLGYALGRRGRKQAVTVAAQCIACGKRVARCDNCAIAYRFRFVETPPAVIRWSRGHHGGAHQEHDCGNSASGGCLKYVRVNE